MTPEKLPEAPVSGSADKGKDLAQPVEAATDGPSNVRPRFKCFHGVLSVSFFYNCLVSHLQSNFISPFLATSILSFLAG